MSSVRAVKTEAVGAGPCDPPASPERLQTMPCNTLKCPKNPKCAGKQDIVLAVDVSGSMKQEGYDMMKQFVAEFFDSYLIDEDHAKFGIIEFSRLSKVVVPLTSDVAELKAGAEKMSFQRDNTRMFKAFSLAGNVLMEGRPDATSLVIVLTDGKPSMKWKTKVAARRLKESGTRIAVVPMGRPDDKVLLKQVASSKSDFINIIPNYDNLSKKMTKKINRIMTATCPMLENPPTETYWYEQMNPLLGKF